MCWHKPPSAVCAHYVWAGQQRSALNVPLGLTHPSARMIRALISPNDWIWSLRERFELPALNPSPCVAPSSLSCVGVFTVTWSDGVRHPQPFEERRLNQTKAAEMRRHCPRRHAKAALHCLNTLPRAAPTDKLQDRKPLEQAASLNCCSIWGAIKKHLGLYKEARSPLWNLLQCRWDERAEVSFMAAAETLAYSVF